MLNQSKAFANAKTAMNFIALAKVNFMKLQPENDREKSYIVVGPKLELIATIMSDSPRSM